MAVSGTPLCGDPALPRPLALSQRFPITHVEHLAAMVARERRAVVALDGVDAASAALLRGFMADLAQQGEAEAEPHAAGVITADGGAHFLCPPCAGAARLLAASLPPGAPPPALTAAGLAVSLLLTDAAAAAAASTRAVILAACAAAAGGPPRA